MSKKASEEVQYIHFPADSKPYFVGFGLSVSLTLLAFGGVYYDWLKGWWLLGYLITLAVLQLYVQLYFFLHLNSSLESRGRLVAFLFSALVVLIIVFGSLWIMTSLSYNHKKKFTPSQIKEKVEKNEAIKKSH